MRRERDNDHENEDRDRDWIETRAWTRLRMNMGIKSSIMTATAATTDVYVGDGACDAADNSANGKSRRARCQTATAMPTVVLLPSSLLPPLPPPLTILMPTMAMETRMPLKADDNYSNSSG